MLLARQLSFWKLSISGMVLLSGCLWLSACTANNSSQLPLDSIANIPLSGGVTRWDYASLDPQRHLLFMAHLGDSTVTVFDTHRRTVIANIHDIDHVHGTLVIPTLGLVFATATGSNELVVIDENSLKIIHRITVGNHPDGMAYAPNVHKLYVSDEYGGTDTIINLLSNRNIGQINIGGKIGNTQYDPSSGHIYINAETSNQLAEVDPIHDTVVSRIPLPGAQGNHGLYIDPTTHFAFIACEDNNKLLVVDLISHHLKFTFDVASDPDVLAYDPGMHWLYVAGESGNVSLFSVHTHLVTSLATAWIGANAHVVAVDPITHLAYFPLMIWHGVPTLRIVAPYKLLNKK